MKKFQSIEKIINADAIVICFNGSLEPSTVRELDDIIDYGNLERDVVIFDFSKATWMSSTILGWLITFRARLVRDNKREPIITGCNDRIYNLFMITGVINLFKFPADSN